MHTDAICSLVLDTCDLLERADDLDGFDLAVVDEARALRAALCSAIGTADDEAVAADAHAAVADLDALLVRLEALADDDALARAA
jgi:hypothetical protein